MDVLVLGVPLGFDGLFDSVILFVSRDCMVGVFQGNKMPTIYVYFRISFHFTHFRFPKKRKQHIN